MCRTLENEGVLGDIPCDDFELNLLPLDGDVLTMCLPEAYKECFLKGVPYACKYVAKAVMKLQSMFGLIPNIKAKGKYANHTLNMIQRYRKEEFSPPWEDMFPEIDTLILLDRNVDMITPLLTQQTYEGMVDDLLGIKYGSLEVEKKMLGKFAPGGDSTTAKVFLNGFDPLFKTYRNVKASALPALFKEKIKRFKELQAEKQEADTLSAIKIFMPKFKVMKEEQPLLQFHIELAEKIKKKTSNPVYRRALEEEMSILRGDDERASEDYIEELIGMDKPLVRVMRMLVLLSVTNNGIRSKKYDFFKRDIIQSYGFDHLFTTQNLEEMGLYKRKERSNAWSTLKTRLSLLKDAKDLSLDDHLAPSIAGVHDLNYLYGGYAPISARLVELAHTQGWSTPGSREVLKTLPGMTQEITQESTSEIVDEIITIDDDPDKPRPVTLVFFIGGVTFSEISALRMLSERDGHERDYIVATTEIITCDSLMGSLIEKLENNLDLSTVNEK